MNPIEILAQAQNPVREDLVRMDHILQSVQDEFSGILQPLGDHVLSVPGKRLRPTMLLLCASLRSRSNGVAPDVAAVVELIHIATLIHDDSIDEGELRRGRPTVHSAWNHQVVTMLGDVLYSRAFEILTEIDEADISSLMAKASHTMSRGELQEFMHRHQLIGEKTYFELIWAKTASFISACCRAGAMLGNLTPSESDCLSKYGEKLGMAFQIVDDILDYTSTTEQLGKEAMADLREGRITLPLIASLRLAGDDKEDVEAELRLIRDGNGSVHVVAEHIEKHGGLDYARRVAEKMSQEALEILTVLPKSKLRRSLELVAEYATKRER